MERKFLLPLLASLFLTACIEINDDNESNASVTLTGSVIDMSTDAAPSDALVSYKIGSQWSDSIPTEDGEFFFEDLPGNSDITLLIKSASDTFMPREVSGKTYYTDEGINFQNLDPINVSPAITYSFSVLDIQTKDAITNLTFTSSINSYGNFNQFSYEFESTFDQSTNKYSVTVPEYFTISTFVASLDTDEDGKNEYQFYDNNNYYSNSQIGINVTTLTSTDTFYLSKFLEETQELEQQLLKLKITVLDQNLNPVEGASLSLVDKLNTVNALYDTELGQYTMDVQIIDEVLINLPSFELNDKLYQSNYIVITVSSEDTLRIYNSNSSHYSYDREYNVDINPNGIDIVVYTQELDVNADTNLSLVAYSQQVDSGDYSYKLFFSVPVELTDGEIELLQSDMLNIVKGNDSNDDLVLSGSTSIEKQDTEVEITTELSLNNTMLTIRPKDPITSRELFKLNIGKIKEKASDIELDVDKSISFYSQATFAETDLFNINSIVLDNNDYRVNNEYIVPNNTANVATPDSYNSQYANLYLPKEVYLLKELTLKKSIIIRDGTQTFSSQLYNLVSNGSLQVSKVNTVSLAKNENIIGNSNSIDLGTSLADGEYWKTSTIEYSISDNTDSSENSVYFEYSFETLKGEVQTGTIKLPIK